MKNATQIFVYDNDGVYDAWCSCCSERIGSHFRIADANGTNYCPNCGAKNVQRINLTWKIGSGSLLFLSNVYDHEGYWLSSYDENDEVTLSLRGGGK